MKSVLLGFGLGVAAGMLLTKSRYSVKRAFSDAKESIKEKLSGENQDCICSEEEQA